MYKILLLIVVVVGALLAACGPGASSNSGTTSGSGAAAPTVVPIAMTEFKIDTPQTTFQVGVPYRFVVSNKGTVNHDFSITPPVMSHSGMSPSNEEAHEDALAVIKADDLPPGATKSVDVTFSKPMSSAEIELACHTPGHYEAGMQVPITVTQ
ncbi:MAG: hypothetical protein IT331_24000 [Anaerolineae bacterium]|nr:hypothetical protein [Anaerolineae bacterium]